MSQANFIREGRRRWTRMDELVKRAAAKGVASLSQTELRELTRLYPAVSVDVARAQMRGLGPKTQRWINQLAVAAHGILYQRRRRSFAAIYGFLARDNPRRIRRLWPYIGLAVAIFLVGALGTYSVVRARPDTAYMFVPQGLDVPGEGGAEATAGDISERYRRMPKPPMASHLITHNIQVAFFAFGAGVAAGIGTCYVILVNAVMLGAFVGHFDNAGLTYTTYSFLTAHGALEITAILVAAGAGLRMGLSLAMPGRLTRKAAFAVGAKDAVYLLLGTIPMFVVAGVFESFVTPAHVPGHVKILIGVGAWAVWLAYALYAGRGQAEPEASAA